MDRDAAQVRDIYVRNQNDRLRTLPLASDVRVNLLQTCEGGGGRDQQLATLAKHASNHLFYYTFQVRGGSVQQIEEHLANPAC